MSKSKRFGLLLVALSLAGLGVSMPVMGAKLAGRAKTVFWFAEPVLGDRFEFADLPVTITRHEPPPDAAPGSPPRLDVAFRGQTVSFPVLGQDNPELPGTLRYGDWFRVYPMASGKGTESEIDERIRRGEIVPSLIIAARYPATGFDPGTWGLVRRKDWNYRIARLHAGGPAESAIEVYDRTYEALDALVAPGPYTKKELILPDEQRERDLWMFYAMMKVTPAPLYRAKDKNMDEALHAMGWTWPVAGGSFVALVLGVTMVAASRVRPPLPTP